MTEILSLEHMAITATGPTLSMSLQAGQSLAIVGPAASGKTHFLHVIAEVDRPEQGAVKVRGEVGVASAEGVPRRTKVNGIIPKTDMAPNGLRVSDLLYRLRLGDARYMTLGELSPGQYAAYELLGPLLTKANVILIDGQLDLLDPWTLKEMVAIIRSLQAAGMSFVAATSRPDILSLFDAVIVLKDKHVRFAGSIEELKRLGPPHSIQVATENQQGVRALVAPFQVTVEQTEGGIRFQATEGQELAARLLLAGYGDVQYVVHRPSTIEEALLSLF